MDEIDVHCQQVQRRDSHCTVGDFGKSGWAFLKNLKSKQKYFGPIKYFFLHWFYANKGVQSNVSSLMQSLRLASVSWLQKSLAWRWTEWVYTDDSLDLVNYDCDT